MKLNKIENNYLNKKTEKQEYISKMYSSHDALFDYSIFIKNRDIQKIEISDSSVIMTSRDLGIKMICSRYDERIAPIEILNFKNYEKNDSDMIFRLVEDNNTVFDIGGNIGWYSIGLSKVKNNLDIYTFEPIPKTYECLIANVKLNGSDVNIYNLGLSDKKQELTFYFHKEGSVNASSALMNENRENIEILCQVDTLDNFFQMKKLKKIDFIKCDIEGAELLAFKGGLETIKQYRPIIFSELLRKWSAKFNYHPNEVIKLFKKIGYGCYFTRHDKLNELQEILDETVETNFFFLHKEKHNKQLEELL